MLVLYQKNYRTFPVGSVFFSIVPCTVRIVNICTDKKDALTLGEKLEVVHRMESW